jgi:hypothetical protein
LDDAKDAADVAGLIPADSARIDGVNHGDKTPNCDAPQKSARPT